MGAGDIIPRLIFLERRQVVEGRLESELQILVARYINQIIGIVFDPRIFKAVIGVAKKSSRFGHRPSPLLIVPGENGIAVLKALEWAILNSGHAANAASGAATRSLNREPLGLDRSQIAILSVETASSLHLQPDIL
jgi:hypothetical protein